MNNNPILNTAFKAARSAGKIIMKSLDKLDELKIKKKSFSDYVTEIDQKSEQEIIYILKKAYPDHAFLAEESGKTGENEYQWIIDPIDGTNNFIHGYPHFCISIALKHKNKIENGLIYDPLKQEVFGASRGRGAFLNEKRLRVNERNKLEGALIGLAYRPKDEQTIQTYLKITEKILTLTTGLRKTGSAALDCCYVASGRLDGIIHLNLNEWDLAAGTLIIKEAGGLLSDFTGSEKYLETGYLIAGNPKILKSLLPITSAL